MARTYYSHADAARLDQRSAEGGYNLQNTDDTLTTGGML
jgi:hypothetical protein